jgi:DNA-binding transcriptional regulator YdaS (Cro superfamily)
MRPLQRAVDLLNGQAALASAIGVKQQNVWNWLNRADGIPPAEYCPAIERETKRVAAEKGDPSLAVTCEQLRPEVAWEVLREQVAPLERSLGVPLTGAELDMRQRATDTAKAT